MSDTNPMIYLGATCKPLSEQLAPYELGSLCVPHAQADADAITRLYVRGVLTQIEKDRAQHRLVARMKRDMKTPRGKACESLRAQSAAVEAAPMVKE